MARKRIGGQRLHPERRSSTRDRRMLDATLKYRGEFYLIEVHDLSESGAYAVAPITPTLSDSVTLNVQMPHLAASVMVTGCVRRVGLSSRALEREGGFGIEFTRFYSQVGRHTVQQHLVA